jgi:phosphocarrier protein
MGIMMLAAEPGSEITLLIDGDDEKEAFAALNELISQKFYEDEK